MADASPPGGRAAPRAQMLLKLFTPAEGRGEALLSAADRLQPSR